MVFDQSRAGTRSTLVVVVVVIVVASVDDAAMTHANALRAEPEGADETRAGAVLTARSVQRFALGPQGKP